MAIWVCGIHSIKDAKRVIKEERLRFPIKVASAYNCNESTIIGMNIGVVNLEKMIEAAIALSPTKEIAFLVS